MKNVPEKRRRRKRYPKDFKNTEEFPLKCAGIFKEFPLLGQGQQWEPGADSGATRVLYPPDKNTDHIDVAYHDKRKGNDNSKNMTLAIYHSVTRASGALTSATGSLWGEPDRTVSATYAATFPKPSSSATAPNGKGSTEKSNGAD